ncbi:MAG: bifunctional folylpolyglutamate synthase/dihydrofolate synthase [Bacteroidota bacterium]
MNYQEGLRFLYSNLPMYQRLGAAAYKNDLKVSLELDRRHNHPHNSFKTIHIAGTNGKGSVSHMLASVLQSAGYKTGLYTSPHLKDFRERIRINGKVIPKQRIIDYLENNLDTIKELKPSFFEMTVDLALLFFKEENVDIAVIETGMGGRLDSTNIIIPLLSVITNIGLDHTRFLGETHAKIAKEKAGIIKENVPVVIGEYHQETFPVFKKMAKEKNAEIYFAWERFSIEFSLMGIDRSSNLLVTDRMKNEKDEVNTDLAGKYQEKNLITVLQSIEVLNQIGLSIKPDHIKEGLKSIKERTGLRGRWEEIEYNPLIVCDTAHNAEGISLVINQLKNLPYRKLHIVWAMVSDKNPGKILRLLPPSAEYYFTKADIPRSMNENILCELAREYGLTGKSYKKSIRALESAKKNALPEDVIFIGGSTFLVGEILEEREGR